MTALKVKRQATRIQQLRVVDAEMARRPQSARHIAAYQVIQCAIEDGLKNPTHRRILSVTLNIIPPDLKTIEARQHLEPRRQLLQGEMSILVRRNYLEHEDEAYEELVALLTSLDETPCHGQRLPTPEQLVEMAVAEVRHRSSQVITMQIPIAPLLEQLLNWYIQSPQRQSEQTSLARACLSLLPRVHPFVGQLVPREGLMDIVYRLTSSADRQAGPPSSMVLRWETRLLAIMQRVFDARDDSRRYPQQVKERRKARRDYRKSFNDWRTLDSEITSSREEIRYVFGIGAIPKREELWPDYVRLRLSGRRSPDLRRIYRSIANSVAVIAQQMANHEEENTWQRLFEPLQPAPRR